MSWASSRAWLEKHPEGVVIFYYACVALLSFAGVTACKPDYFLPLWLAILSPPLLWLMLIYRFNLNTFHKEIGRYAERDLFFKAMHESMPLGVVILDEKNRIANVNHKMCDITGYTRGEMLGHSLIELLFPPQKQKEALENYQKILHGEAESITPETKTEILLKNGTHLWLRHSIKPESTMLWNGQCYAISTFMDISEEMLLEQRRAEQNQLLIQQYKLSSIGNIVAAIIQQYRQPLSAISLRAGRLQHMMHSGATPQSPAYKEELQKIIEDTLRLSGFLDDFHSCYLDAPASDSFEVLRALCEVERVATQMLKVSFFSLQTTLSLSEKECIHGSKTWFQQIVLNLIWHLRERIEKSPERTLGDDTLILQAHKNTALHIMISSAAIGLSCDIEAQQAWNLVSSMPHEEFSLQAGWLMVTQGFGGALYMDNLVAPRCFLLSFSEVEQK